MSAAHMLCPRCESTPCRCLDIAYGLPPPSPAGEGAQETRCRVVHAPDCDGECVEWAREIEHASALPPERAALVEYLDELKVRWQGMEQQALEPPANLHFAELAHNTWVTCGKAAAALRGEAQPEEGR